MKTSNPILAAILLAAVSAMLASPASADSDTWEMLRGMREIAAQHRQEFTDFCSTLQPVQPTPELCFQAAEIMRSIAPDPVLGAQTAAFFQNAGLQLQNPYPQSQPMLPMQQMQPMLQVQQIQQMQRMQRMQQLRQMQQLQEMIRLIYFLQWLQQQQQLVPRRQRFRSPAPRRSRGYGFGNEDWEDDEYDDADDDDEYDDDDDEYEYDDDDDDEDDDRDIRRSTPKYAALALFRPA